MSETLLKLVNLSKHFGSLSALENVSLQLRPGEVLGVVGRRGAGKSVLMHLIAGVLPPSAGEIHLDGKAVQLASPIQARRFGIQMLYQKPLLAANLDVLQNVLLGHEIGQPLQLGVPDLARMAEQARDLLAQLDMPPSLLHEKTSNLSDEQQQAVALARVLCRPARLLLLDDALAALSFQRQQRLLELLRGLAARGTSLIITSDDLKHLFAITQRIVVLYEGRVTADRLTAECTPREIVELIVGTTRREQVTPIIWALENYQAAQQQTEALRQVEASLRESLEARDVQNRQLLERLRNQVEALDQLNLALQAAQRRMMTEREQERKYLARELHDQVIQDLLSFNYQLEDVESDLSANAAKDELVAIRRGIRQVVSDLRLLCSDLRPPAIDSHGLAAAIRSFAQEWAEKNGIELSLEIDPQLGRMPETIELSVFRIVQEGLNNIRKHASARQVQLTLQRTPAAGLLVRLGDDGRGLQHPPDLAALSATRHYGLVSISERVALLGGVMHVDSPAGGGALLEVEIPSPYPSV